MKRICTLFALLFVFATVAVPATEPTQKPATVKPAQEKVHWLTIKSGIRHNSKCRYYQNSKGRPCTKDEGRACKICGG